MRSVRVASAASATSGASHGYGMESHTCSSFFLQSVFVPRNRFPVDELRGSQGIPRSVAQIVAADQGEDGCSWVRGVVGHPGVTKPQQFNLNTGFIMAGMALFPFHTSPLSREKSHCVAPLFRGTVAEAPGTAEAPGNARHGERCPRCGY